MNRRSPGRLHGRERRERHHAAELRLRQDAPNSSYRVDGAERGEIAAAGTSIDGGVAGDVHPAFVRGIRLSASTRGHLVRVV